MRLLYLWRLSRALKRVQRTRRAYEAALGGLYAVARSPAPKLAPELAPDGQA